MNVDGDTNGEGEEEADGTNVPGALGQSLD